VYRITDVGRRTFAELLAGGGPDDARTFGLRLSFARHLPPTARLTLLERRRAVLMERLAEARRAEGDASLDVYARSVMEHTTEGVASDIRWLDRLIEVERNNAAADSTVNDAGLNAPINEPLTSAVTSAGTDTDKETQR
jgi:hypothetical protein